jgi:hypothetical protein
VGLLWESYQQLSNRAVDDAQSRLELSLAERVAWLEQAVVQQNQFLGELVRQLELRFGEDLNGDQRIG